MSQNSRSMPLYRLVLCGFLVALSIVCGKFLQIPIGEAMRFSLENLPVLFAGLVFGPLSGALVGVAADLLGCLMVGYAINPLVTAGAAAIGLLAGVGGVLLHRLPVGVRVPLSVAVAHLVGSVVIKTVGLAQYYALPPVALMGWRLLNYAIVGTVEAVLLCLLLRHKGLQRMTGG